MPIGFKGLLSISQLKRPGLLRVFFWLSEGLLLAHRSKCRHCFLYGGHKLSWEDNG